ncbi:hypothetical protein AVEN_269311-1 [Araneus ventricosus]|uniref:Uncharacterized protein n=1 Tax=Araneus ventricosus TaxID=182803 RepID=A0A4Y2I361_ARAVE|nr:hypothetical protein AVEN_269311-1 [Araneus ventricosus]
MVNYPVVSPSKRADHMCGENSSPSCDSEICHMPLTRDCTVDACDSVCHIPREKAKTASEIFRTLNKRHRLLAEDCPFHEWFKDSKQSVYHILPHLSFTLLPDRGRPQMMSRLEGVREIVTVCDKGRGGGNKKCDITHFG